MKIMSLIAHAVKSSISRLITPDISIITFESGATSNCSFLTSRYCYDDNKFDYLINVFFGNLSRTRISKSEIPQLRDVECLKKLHTGKPNLLVWFVVNQVFKIMNSVGSNV